MTTRPFADKRLLCASCGDGFIFSAGEQELYQLRGVSREPQRCPSCSRGAQAQPAMVATRREKRS